MTGNCEFSPDRKYRYALCRRWDMQHDLCADVGGPHGHHKDAFLVIIGLNPSTADERQDDPTIRRCIDFAQRWGYTGLCMLNLFALRSTDPDKLRTHPNPIGPENNAALLKFCRACDALGGQIVAAWGNHGMLMNRDTEVWALLHPLPVLCFKQNKDGAPKHPLYVPADTLPIPFDISAATRAKVRHGRSTN